jgi:hypothetical protein
MTAASVLQWPSIRGVARQLDVSTVHVLRLIQTGRLSAERCALGWLVDPTSVSAYAEVRHARKAAKSA